MNYDKDPQIISDLEILYSALIGIENLYVNENRWERFHDISEAEPVFDRMRHLISIYDDDKKIFREKMKNR